MEKLEHKLKILGLASLELRDLKGGQPVLLFQAYAKILRFTHLCKIERITYLEDITQLSSDTRYTFLMNMQEDGRYYKKTWFIFPENYLTFIDPYFLINHEL